MLQIKAIKKDYYVGEQTIQALKGLSVDFRRNEFVSILGPSGCGKTTLMNIIGGLDRATSGELLIEGRSTKDYSDNEWDNYRNKMIGFVFQSYNLIPHLSVYGNVEIALTISGMSVADRKKRVLEVLEEVGLTDQKDKRPNQLSGGQSQRVSIARALVNNPEILLADEPTGALDTETSEQIMKLIKKVAQDKLVIMVTHNPDLANRYSTRVINMLDGIILNDSNPYDAASDMKFISENEHKLAAQKMTSKKNKKEKTSMSFWTALSLSRRNLFSKRGRTILTAIAGSIGIIGIALILALSGGVNNYIDKLQTDTLSSNPITISSTSINITQAMNSMRDREVFQTYPTIDEIYVEKAMNAASIMSKNNITDEYIAYLNNNLDSSWYNDVTFFTGLKMNIYGIKSGSTSYSKLENNSTSGGFGGMSTSTTVWQQLLETSFINSQYDILSGTYPTNKNEIVIIVSETNQIPESTLISLGLLKVGDDIASISFNDVIGKEYKLVSNDLMYEKIGSNFVEKSPLDINYNAAEAITISGILRIKESSDSNVLSTGIGYTKELYDYLQVENYASEIIQFMIENPTLSPFSGLVYEDTLTQTKEEQRDGDLRALGGSLTANEINIYPTNFTAKEAIKAVLNDYNEGKDTEDMVTYTDMSELLGDTLSSLVDIITYVLIAFTAISLVVSCIMIAIITYVSVLERTKEIGVLRSVGARKRDVTRIFNAETFIIGLIAGLIGVLIAYILSVPINFIVNMLVGVNGIASLNIGYAILLIAISVVLTMLSGLIPARKAAKQDPVAALRTE